MRTKCDAWAKHEKVECLWDFRADNWSDWHTCCLLLGHKGEHVCADGAREREGREWEWEGVE